MVRDTAETKRRLLAAAAEEFAAAGAGGARVDRIAARAGVNKERLYSYFGDKERLFAAVLRAELSRLAEAVPLEAGVDLGDYAGRVFDYHVEHPALLRLLLWEGLHFGERAVPDQEERSGYYAAKVAVLAADRGLDGPAAGTLLLRVIGAAAWPLVVPQLTVMLTGRGATHGEGRAAARAWAIGAARALGADGAATTTSDPGSASDR